MSRKGIEKLEKIKDILDDAYNSYPKDWWPDQIYEQKSEENKNQELSRLTHKQIWKLKEMVETELDILKRWQ
jgi:hypothetical protein